MAEAVANRSTTTDRGSVFVTVKTGLDRLVAEDFARLRGQRVGLLMHPASVDAHWRSASDLMLASRSVDLRALFGPQHGLLGQTQDNMIEWEGSRDERTGLAVHSLYGKHRQPTAEMVRDIDTLVVDLQDVGARYYTFIWTLLLAMETCAREGTRIVVLDRPNPLGGLQIEGTVLQPGFESFVGLAEIPMRHGLTIGELANLFSDRLVTGAELEVVPIQGWRRAMYFRETGLPWVLPSPNMPTLETAVVYPGGCLLEGTALSEGRGTTRPFEILGAPYIDPPSLLAELDPALTAGAVLRPLYFQPTFHKFSGEVCGGVQVHVLDREVFRPVACYTAIIAAVARLWPAQFAWKRPPYEYETEKLPIDILTGGTLWREAVESNTDPAVLVAGWEEQIAAFAADTRQYHLYD